jgi:hypothetical protein
MRGLCGARSEAGHASKMQLCAVPEVKIYYRLTLLSLKLRCAVARAMGRATRDAVEVLQRVKMPGREDRGVMYMREGEGKTC